MGSRSEPRIGRFLPRGTGSVFAVLVVILVLLVALPAYRWFFLISVAIGLVVALVLYLWHKLNPITEDKVENKRPLGLE